MEQLINKTFTDNGGTYKVKGSEKEVMYNWIKELKDVRRVIDIGCGNGFFSYFLAKEFSQFEVIGIDSDKDYIKYANENFKSDNLKFIESDIEGLDKLELRLFDLVIFSEVIEHFPNVNLILQKISNITKQKGIMIISTDNLYSTIIHSFLRYVILKKPIKYEQWYHQEGYPDREWPWAHHLYSFSLETLATSLKIAGFETERYRYSNHQSKRSLIKYLFPILKPKIILQCKKRV
jgi:2-polyprenyl-3-methyl-5-hydroxy-6-metoxy-1,4-benzoquinol methylase